MPIPVCAPHDTLKDAHRYLLAVASAILLLNWVSTNGESLLFGSVQTMLEEEVRSQGLTDPAAARGYVVDGTTAFYGAFFFWTNLAALLTQALLVSRLVKLGGLGLVLLSLPVVALLSYSLAALLPVLGIMKIVKIAENATSYSVNNTANQLLWLPATTEMKYKAKAVIDTIFVRMGDGFSALTMFAGFQILQLSLRQLYLFNVTLVAIWLIAAVAIVHEHRQLSRAADRRIDLRQREAERAQRPHDELGDAGSSTRDVDLAA